MLVLRAYEKSGFMPDFSYARETGLEPATSAVTGQRSNQLSYSRIRYATGKILAEIQKNALVSMGGNDPPTSAL